MPMGEYSSFADCVSKNKGKDDPKAYCGYIKNQIEGGKKKEEVMDFPEHELFHLEETLKTEERPFMINEDAIRQEQPDNDEDDEDNEYCGCDEGTRLRKDCPVHYGGPPHGKSESGHAGDRQTRLPKGVRHTIERMGGPEDWTPEPTIEEASAFLKTLKATIDEVTLLAKDTGYMGVSEKVTPTPPTYSFPVSGDLVDTVVHNVKGFDVQTNFFNDTMSNLKDIVKDATKFFEDAGWNSKETVKEYAKHMKRNGKDFD